MNWFLTKQAHISSSAKVELFYSADSLEAYRLIDDLLDYDDGFVEKTDFIPHIMTYDNGSDGEIDSPNCLNSGRYCASADPSLGVENGLEIVNEGLRQRCVWESLSDPEKGSRPYFDYMRIFYDKCVYGVESKITVECSLSVIEELQLDKQKILSCTNTLDSQGRIKALEASKQTKQELHVFIKPTLVINKKQFRGALTGINVIEAICSSLENKPEVCFWTGQFKHEDGVGYFAGAVIVGIVLLVNILLFLCCKRILFRKINEGIDHVDVSHKITNVVSSYVSLSGSRK